MTTPAPVPAEAPYVKSVLVLAVVDGQVLLMRKLRGLGAGKINGPGGKIEPGETEELAAVRETEEELGVTPLGLRRAGELWFHFTDGFRLHCAVFRADAIVGELRATEEGIPFWFKLNAIPFHEMWADDIFWLPLLLEGDRFEGRFTFDGDKMLEHKIRVLRDVPGQGPTVDGCCG